MIKHAFLTAIIALAATSTALAETVEQHRVTLAPQTEQTEMVVAIATYQPGEVIPRHSHPGVEALFVVQGATVALPNGKQITLKTGANLLNPRDKVHAGFTVVGDTALKIYTVHVVDAGKPLYVQAESGN